MVRVLPVQRYIFFYFSANIKAIFYDLYQYLIHVFLI